MRAEALDSTKRMSTQNGILMEVIVARSGCKYVNVYIYV